MVQTLKPEVRAQLMRAAEVVFAERGYRGATVAMIAHQAGVSTGNVYRYFDNKDALFYAVISDAFVASFMQLVRRRVHLLAASADITRPVGDAAAAESELLTFWLENRLRVVTLLAGAEGTRHEGFGARFADELVQLTLARLRREAGGRRLRPVVRSTLQHVFENTVRTLGAILAQDGGDAATREAFRAFWSYQLAGLAGLERWVISDDR